MQKSKFISNVPSELHGRNVLGGVKVELPKEPVLDVVEDVLMDDKGRSLPFQLEDQHASIVTYDKI